MRHADEPAVRGYAVTYPGGPTRLPQADGWEQLIYASRGVMTVHTDAGAWVIPPDRAVWVPAGVGHRLDMAGPTAIRTVYLQAGLVTMDTRAVNVSPLLRELLLHVIRLSPLDLTVAAHERLLGVLVDQFAALPVAPLGLPMPEDPRARAAAAMVRADPSAAQPVVALARAVGASRRTLERLFRAETGLSVGQWRERARLLAALPMLARGAPVAKVAHATGYSTPSAFGAMFRRVFGTSPARYFSAR
jgi:AraC-like DNA-binding protein